MNNINGFTFFRNYYKSLSRLNQETRRELLEAIVNYVFEDIEPNFEDGVSFAIWTAIEPNLNSSKSHSRLYQEKTKKKSKKIKSKSNENQNESNENQNEVSDILENKNKNKKKNKNENKKRKEEGDICSTITTTTNINALVDENFDRNITPLEHQMLNNWVDEFGEDVVKHAIEICISNGNTLFNYLAAILRNWKKDGLMTMDQINRFEEIYYSAKSGRSRYDMYDFNWLEDDDYE